jgi:hypothetical protein
MLKLAVPVEVADKDDMLVFSEVRGRCGSLHNNS